MGVKDDCSQECTSQDPTNDCQEPCTRDYHASEEPSTTDCHAAQDSPFWSIGGLVLPQTSGASFNRTTFSTRTSESGSSLIQSSGLVFVPQHLYCACRVLVLVFARWTMVTLACARKQF